MFTRVCSRRHSISVILSSKWGSSGSTNRVALEQSKTACEIVKAVKFPAYSTTGTRRFGTSTNEICLLDESQFHLIADETLEEIVNYLDIIESSLDDFEVDLSVSY